ncbi:hypothetical protein ES707_19867 [subsurface metagenome]
MVFLDSFPTSLPKAIAFNPADARKYRDELLAKPENRGRWAIIAEQDEHGWIVRRSDNYSLTTK